MSYAEIYCRSNFSFLRGASHPGELVRRAAALGYSGLAITDENSLAGIVRAHTAARTVKLKLLIGAEITPRNAPPVVLLATDRASYGRLARLITRGRRRTKKGDCRLSFDDVAAFSEGLHAAVSPEGLLRTQKSQSRHAAHLRKLQRYGDLFGSDCSLMATLHLHRDDRGKLAQLQALSQSLQLPLVAAGDVRYHTRRRRALHEAVTAVRHSTTVRHIRQHLPPMQNITCGASPRYANSMRPHQRQSSERSKLPTPVTFRSTSFATNIPQNSFPEE